ncbi:kinase-like domain-containing protein [Rhizophagus clarus]|nr:kinase-like domain-containing protein [Rhizophagus clarus]
MLEKNLNSNNVDSSNTNSLLYKELSQIIQNFDKMDIREIEPTTQYIHDNIFEKDLNSVINEMVMNYFRKVNEGKTEIFIKKHALEYINNLEINLQEMINWLLDNQNDSNSIYLLGYFYYHGVGVSSNMQNALELYQKAANLENNAAQFDLANMYIDGEGGDKDYEKAFELSEKLTEKEYLCGINLLGFCYDNGIGTDINPENAFSLYKKAAELGNYFAQYNIALMYEKGSGTEKSIEQAIYWFKKSAEQGDLDDQDKLEELLNE